MKIKRVYIENYRSIKKLDFSPNNYCVLVGENNAGKSNVLKAINLVLGESWPTDRAFSEEDFHNQDTTADIIIQIYFDEIIEEWRNNCKCEIAGFELRSHAYKRKTGAKPAGYLTTSFTCINGKGEACKYPPEKLEKGKQPSGIWYELKVSRDLKDRVPFIYVDVLRDYNKQDPGNRWSILRRLLDDVNKSLTSDKKTVNVETADGKVKMTRKQAFEYKIKEAYNYLKTTEFEEIETKIRANSLEQMGIDAIDGDISIRFDTYDPMNVFKNLQLFVDQMGISTTADMVGAGLQSAIVIAIFRTYEEIKREGAIFAIEEPEVFLHPQKQRYFSTILEGLSAKNQIFITTHSPVFVKLYSPEEVCLIRRNKTDGTIATICEKDRIIKSEKEALKIQNYFDNQRNELFFAKGVILVEGATEKFAFPYGSRKKSIDLDRFGISVIECGGKGNILTFAKVADAFNIPYVAVVDDDIKDLTKITEQKKRARLEAQNKDHTQKNDALKAFIPAERLFWMVPNIESMLGISENSDNKIMRILDYFKQIDNPDNLPENIISVIDKIMELVNPKEEEPTDEL